MIMKNLNNSLTTNSDIICFSHLRWDFVFQRPHHLMSRFAKHRRVFFVEEPILYDGPITWHQEEVSTNVMRCVPYINESVSKTIGQDIYRLLLNLLAEDWNLSNSIFWYYTPMMLDWAADIKPKAIVYDCMDELSAFKDPPKGIIEQEDRLLDAADIVFTGGHSLYNSKRHRHPAVYEFPSSIDIKHFNQALAITEEMPEQAYLPRPRIGYAGVIDERIDLELLAQLAEKKPEWQFIMLGPVVKIEISSLPNHSNIHYLGKKDYSMLPSYFAGWDVAIMPFALNESTEFISPTKTPEYLTAGLPVISTPIADVIRPYGEEGLVHIAGSAADFIDAIHYSLAENKLIRLSNVDRLLKGTSWDMTFEKMERLVNEIHVKQQPVQKIFSEAVGMI